MHSEIALAVDRFLQIFHMRMTSTKDIEKLMEVLDQLAWLAHDVKLEFDERDYPIEVGLNRQATVSTAKLWLQGICKADDQSNVLAIDAIMDLSEIVDDMEEIRWRFGNSSNADALFHFQLGFRSHWGHHLRCLQKTLHEWYW